MFGFFKRHKKLTAVIVAVLLIGSYSSERDKEKVATPPVASVQKQTPKQEREQAEKQYIETNAAAMLTELEQNAMRAKKTYNGKDVIIYGARVYNIDSDGDYINVCGEDNDMAITGIIVEVCGEEQRNWVEALSVGQVISIQGRITDVGEVLGYSLKLEKIE